MNAERSAAYAQQQPEKKSIWNSRVFKVSLLVLGAGVIVNSILLAEAGLLSAAGSGGWYLATKKEK